MLEKEIRLLPTLWNANQGFAIRSAAKVAASQFLPIPTYPRLLPTATYTLNRYCPSRIGDLFRSSVSSCSYNKKSTISSSLITFLEVSSVMKLMITPRLTNRPTEFWEAILHQDQQVGNFLSWHHKL